MPSSTATGSLVRSARTRIVAVVGGLGVLLASACAPAAQSTPSADTQTADQRTAAPTSGPPSAAGPPREVISGLTSPWEVLRLDDGSLLVSERDTAKIRHVRDAEVRDLVTIEDVQPSGEGGLLGLALTPAKDTVLAYYSGPEDNRIVAMSWDGATLGAPRVLLDGIPSGGRHNGGRMAVGPDGLLYVGTGEVGDVELAQDRNSLGGKILRLTLDGAPAPGNPFGNEVWSYGHRNVEGLAFDPDGRLWASEFGEQSWDELNLITRGANYGWPLVEGSGAVDGLTNPKVVWTTEEASPAGLTYAGGSLWMAALRGTRLWQIPVSGTDAGEPRAHLRDELGRLRTVLPAGDDELLVVTSNTDGRGDVREGDDRIVRLPLP